MNLKRHDFIWVDKKSKNIKVSKEYEIYLREWIEKGNPLIVKSCLFKREDISAGFTVDNKKISVNLNFLDIDRFSNAPFFYELTNITNSVNIFLLNLSEKYNVSFMIYGSYAWEFLTGINQTNKSSDLDVLIYFKNKINYFDLKIIVDNLSSFEDIEIDGELILTDGFFINFKESVGNSKEVLIKSRESIELISRFLFNKKYLNI